MKLPDLRPQPAGVGTRTINGTRAAVRTVIRYRHGVLSGRGASLLDGYMEDLATDRIYRLMIAQRVLHRDLVQVQVAGQTPAVRYGEVLVADSERIEGWRNLGQTEAVLFWIVIPAGHTTRPRRLA